MLLAEKPQVAVSAAGQTSPVPRGGSFFISCFFGDLICVEITDSQGKLGQMTNLAVTIYEAKFQFIIKVLRNIL